MILVAGVQLADGADAPVLRHVSAPGTAELHSLGQRLLRALARCRSKAA